MTEVTRFPHYHQAENVITNHVMVMLRTIYNVSPKLLEELLAALCDESISVGPRFSQQIVGSRSIPDGLILQEPLALFVETKLGSSFNADQLKRHCQSIADRYPNRGGNFLVALATGGSGSVLPGDVIAIAKELHVQVVVASFRGLVEQIGQLQATDIELRDTIQEFSDFVFARGLVPREDQFMVAMLTGTSWRENLAHGVYYEPAERSAKWPRAAFLGLYHDRHVSHVGRIATVVVAVEAPDGRLMFETPEKGVLTDEQKQAVKDIGIAAQAYYPNFQRERHRLYLVDRFEPTDFRKETAGGMMGHRYFDIEEITGTRIASNATGQVAADALKGKSYD